MLRITRYDLCMFDIQQRIEELVASNPGQMTVPEYAAIAGELQMRGPCSLLVFGLGRDTDLWVDINVQGRTSFLEHDSRFITLMRTRSEAVSRSFTDPKTRVDVYEVKYRTVLRSAETYKVVDDAGAAMRVLGMDLPPRVRDHQWDVILVDAPPGDGPERPGRFQSIYEAMRLAAPDACVFFHDIHRPVERWFSTRFLGKSIEEVGHLGVFGTKAKRPRR